MGCAIKMTFYKLSGTLKAIVIVDKIDEKNIENGRRGFWDLFCTLSHVNR